MLRGIDRAEEARRAVALRKQVLDRQPPGSAVVHPDISDLLDRRQVRHQCRDLDTGPGKPVQFLAHFRTVRSHDPDRVCLAVQLPQFLGDTAAAPFLDIVDANGQVGLPLRLADQMRSQLSHETVAARRQDKIDPDARCCDIGLRSEITKVARNAQNDLTRAGTNAFAVVQNPVDCRGRDTDLTGYFSDGGAHMNGNPC